MSPLSGTNAMDDYYSLLLEGKPDDAEAKLREEAKKGIPLPIESK